MSKICFPKVCLISNSRSYQQLLITDHCSLITGKLLLHDAENFFLAHDQELFTVDLDLGA
jgi:hypothetical protein